tara:strand:- start:414 stop:548 length:135 start_codon:yes stop_codon:yes gene_type:complete
MDKMDGISDVDKTVHNFVKILKEKYSLKECCDIMEKINLDLSKN